MSWLLRFKRLGLRYDRTETTLRPLLLLAVSIINVRRLVSRVEQPDLNSELRASSSELRAPSSELRARASKMPIVNQPTADQALSRLHALTGVWTVEAGPPGAPTQPLGKATITWLGSFLTIDTRFAEASGPPSGKIIIGCDAGNGTYTQLYSDERGVGHTYSMTLDEERWTLRRDGDPFPQRFTATITPDVLAGRWEKAPDGGPWEVDFELVHRRLEHPS